jgi:hypothetical protein
MGKRKRDDEDEIPNGSADDRKRRQLQVQIARGLSGLTAALEQARRFERQKLGRRQHGKSRGDVDGRKINVEIANLKALDMRKIAEQKLHKNLIKTPSIAKTGLLPEDVKLPANGAIDKSTADLLARLFKQRAVAEALEATMTAVRRILISQSDQTKSPDGLIRIPSEKAVERPHVKAVLSLSGDEDSSSEEFTAFDDGLASSSSDEAITESQPRQPASRSKSEIDSEHESDSATAAQKPTASAFLPSLSMTGYMSGSDSDATDVEDHVAPRKNRRGQRARQAIWEKKYKEKAKHVKTPSKKKDKRDEGWDPQKGAIAQGDAQGHRRVGDRRAAGPKQAPSGGNAAPLANRYGTNGPSESKPKHRDDGGALHPSWQAKKQMKKQSVGIGGFKGKKVTFD